MIDTQKIVDKIRSTDVLQSIDTVEYQGDSYLLRYFISGVATKKICGWIIDVVEQRESEKIEAHVSNAMKALYCNSEYKAFAEHCRCRLYADGRFSLSCFGDATDVSIYPDGLVRDDEYYGLVRCHNIDSPFQQIVLLIGLLKLCESAQQAAA